MGEVDDVRHVDRKTFKSHVVPITGADIFRPRGGTVRPDTDKPDLRTETRTTEGYRTTQGRSGTVKEEDTIRELKEVDSK